MNPELKQRWLAALRSGEYKQGSIYLKRETNTGEFVWCCLGVLCDLVDPRRWIKSTTSKNLYGWESPSQTGLPRVNLEKEFFQHKAGGVFTKLSNMNDGTTKEYKHSFEAIADYIESEL